MGYIRGMMGFEVFTGCHRVQDKFQRVQEAYDGIPGGFKGYQKRYDWVWRGF